MEILTIDIGNTNIVIGCAEDHKVQFVERMHTSNTKTDLEYAIDCHMVLELHKIDAAELDGAIISSVVPPLTDKLSAAIQKLTGITPMIVGPGIKTGINILMDQPAQVGSDLVVAAVAAIHDYGAPVIIIDMGTATTMTVVDKNRNFIGGLILPGVQIALQSLENSTAQLPKIHLKAPAKVIGGNTIDSMQSGLVFGNASALEGLTTNAAHLPEIALEKPAKLIAGNTVGAMQSGSIFGQACCVDGMIDRIWEDLGYETAVVASGGFAGTVIPNCKPKITVDAELLPKGLTILYEKNAKHSRKQN